MCTAGVAGLIFQRFFLQYLSGIEKVDEKFEEILPRWSAAGVFREAGLDVVDLLLVIKLVGRGLLAIIHKEVLHPAHQPAAVVELRGRTSQTMAAVGVEHQPHWRGTL